MGLELKEALVCCYRLLLSLAIKVLKFQRLQAERLAITALREM